MSFACIFVPDFPVQAVVRAEPELCSHAVAVLEGKPPLEKVLAVNEEARRAGIAAGMTKLQAQLCEEVSLRDRSQLQEEVAHQALLDCAQSFSPRVEDAAPDTLLLDVSGLEKLFGALPKIAREIFRRASQLGFEANVAVASSLEAAQLAAQGFSGVTVVPDKKEAEFLGSLLVDVLFADGANPDVAEEFLETFRRWGIRKLRDLAALPEVELSERLGQRGLELRRKAQGVGTRTLVPGDPPLVFEEALELEYPLVLLEPLAFVLNHMLEQLCARLEARALAAQELRLELTLENGHKAYQDTGDTTEGAPPLSLRFLERQGGIFQRTIHLPVPLLNPQTFLKLLQLDLKAHPPGAPVVKVRLHIAPTKPRPGQNGFFVPSSPEPEKLELTLARISAIVGEGRVGSPALLDSHRREAFEIRRFTPSAVAFWSTVFPYSKGQARRPFDSLLAVGRSGQAPSPHNIDSNGKNGNPHAQKELVTALRIFRPPLPVSVTQESGKPSRISFKKESQISTDVLWAAGPWRSSGDWWEHDAWLRDEWDIAVQEDAGIALYRLVHDLLGGKWMLEGSYD